MKQLKKYSTSFISIQHFSMVYMFFLLTVSCVAKANDDFVIANNASHTNFYLDENADELVKWAVNDLLEDLDKMTGKKFNLIVTSTYTSNNKGVYVGTFADALINSLPKKYSVNLQNQWEKFLIQESNQSLFLVGSDTRATVYAIFELAERIGISPWKWWADVTPQNTNTIILKLPKGGIEEQPSVKFRGIFLNDEDWGLQPWAAKTFEPETNDIGPKTYEKIFQLLLRLKANTIWPAMHPSTKPFFTIHGNKEMAKKYHITIGTSHAEPMLRNNVGEWNEKINGHFNYFDNSEKVQKYWQERISESTNVNALITLGMRGIHDSGMEGNASKDEKVKLLEKIIMDQRAMLSKTFNKPIEQIPQVFTIYKEVLDFYDAGMKIPEDVSLIWTDDNYGYIHRLSNKEEQERKGGSGIYYHLSYWGRPHDYLWLSTSQPAHIWYEMTRAFQNGAQKLWIANVGDIKPGEYAMEFFLDLAWDINCVEENSIKKHLVDWCSREFGTGNSQTIATIMAEYYRLAFLRKPEYMGWSQTEPTTSTRITEFSVNENNNEVQRRMDAYAELVNKVESIKLTIPLERQDAFFQLVEYPIKGAALMNNKFLLAQQSLMAETDLDKKALQGKSQSAFDQIMALTNQYNNKTSNGKWKDMMSMQPRALPAFKMPTYHLKDTLIDHKSITNKKYTAPIFIQANEFSKVSNLNNYKWKVIDGLGYSEASMTLSPYENSLFSNDLPYLEYTFDTEEIGNYTIEIRCIPTHSNNYDHQVGVQVNGQNHMNHPINTRGRSEEWKQNVLRNYTPVLYNATFKKIGPQTLRIDVNQPGIVIDQIAIYPEKQKDFYEIIKQ